MRNRAFYALRTLAVCACLTLCAVSQAFAATGRAMKEVNPAAMPQEQSKDKKKEKKEKPVTVPEPELKAAKAIEAAADVPATLAAANEFLQKYPKSPLRPQLAPLVAHRIGLIQDPAERIAQSESYLKVFNAPGDAELVNQHLLAAYTESNRLDDAFALAPTAIDKSYDPVAAMINLARGGLAEARNSLASAIRLSPRNADNYVLLSTMANDEYQRLAQAQKAAAPGAEKDALLKQAEAQMDEVIDAYARTIALTEGNAQYDAMRVGLKADLESYYRYRHAGSTDGLQALIDKYKKL
jgi:hypothetical protein